MQAEKKTVQIREPQILERNRKKCKGKGKEK